MKINRLDFIFGLVVILVAGSYIFMAMQIPESLLSDTVGAGGLPRMLGWAMMGLGALVCLRSVRSGSAVAKVVPVEEEDDAQEEAPTGLRPHLLALGLLLILSVYVFITPYLGYIITSPLLIGAVARFSGTVLNRHFFIIAIVGGLTLWLLFDPLLSIPMPVGSIWEGR